MKDKDSTLLENLYDNVYSDSVLKKISDTVDKCKKNEYYAQNNGLHDVYLALGLGDNISEDIINKIAEIPDLSSGIASTYFLNKKIKIPDILIDSISNEAGACSNLICSTLVQYGSDNIETWNKIPKKIYDKVSKNSFLSYRVAKHIFEFDLSLKNIPREILKSIGDGYFYHTYFDFISLLIKHNFKNELPDELFVHASDMESHTLVHLIMLLLNNNLKIPNSLFDGLKKHFDQNFINLILKNPNFIRINANYTENTAAAGINDSGHAYDVYATDRYFDDIDIETLKPFEKYMSQIFKDMTYYPRLKAKKYNQIYKGAFLHTTDNIEKTLNSYKNSEGEICVSTLRVDSMFRNPEQYHRNVLLIGFGDIKYLFDFDAYSIVGKNGKRYATRNLKPDNQDEIHVKHSFEGYDEKNHYDEGFMKFSNSKVLIAVISDEYYKGNRKGGRKTSIDKRDMIKYLKSFNHNIKIISVSKFKNIRSTDELLSGLYNINDIDDDSQGDDYEKYYESFKQYLEAANFAQQAAIAINMKKHHKKPKNKGKRKNK
jgi:hypothetical protein